MQRRRFLQVAAGAGGALAVGSGFWTRVLASEPAMATSGPYGPLGPPDANGIRLPVGYTSRIVAESLQPVAGAPLVGGAPLIGVWHVSPDGAATFPTDDGVGSTCATARRPSSAA